MTCTTTIKCCCYYIVMTFLWVAAGPVLALDIPTQSTDWYYEIGGAEPVSRPANGSFTTFEIGGGSELGLGYSCGNFDLISSITSELEEIFDTDKIEAFITNLLTAAVGSLPLLILERNAPDLYDLFQTYRAKAEATVTLANKTCEQIEAETRNGKNPYEGWVQVSKSYSWKEKANDDNKNGTNDGSVQEAKEEVEEENGDIGVPWFYGGLRGGLGQDPIRLLYESIAGGYNATHNRPPSTDFTTTASDSRISEIWPTPDEAAKWGVDVLGDQIIRTCNGCTKSAQPGGGLLPAYQETTTEIFDHLANLIDGTLPLTAENLELGSASGVVITWTVIEAIRNLPGSDRTILVSRLAADVAVGRLIEQALMIRRTLLTSKGIPEIRAINEAVDGIDEAVLEIEREVDNLLFETRVRRETASKTIQTIMAVDRGLREVPLNQPRRTKTDTDQVELGRIPR